MEVGLDVLQKQGLDVALFEVVGTVKDKCIAPDVHGLQLVKPGGDGGLREFFLQLRQDAIPYVCDRIQKETPLSSKK